MVNMVPHETFVCSCAEGDVVLRQSYKPESFGKLYYACPKSKVNNQIVRNILDVDFLWKETRLRQLMSSPEAASVGPSTPSSYFLGPSTPPSYSLGPSTPPNYSSGSSRNAEQLEDKAKAALEWELAAKEQQEVAEERERATEERVKELEEQVKDIANMLKTLNPPPSPPPN
nr:hypothetical protein [Tanacetum cinerariifolium]